MADTDYYQMAGKDKTFHFDLELVTKTKDLPEEHHGKYLEGIKIDFTLYNANGDNINPHKDQEFGAIMSQLREELEKRNLVVTDHSYFNWNDRGAFTQTYTLKNLGDQEYCTPGGLITAWPELHSKEGTRVKEALFQRFQEALKAIGAEPSRKFAAKRHLIKHLVEQPEDAFEAGVNNLLKPHIDQSGIRSRVVAEIADLARRTPPSAKQGEAQPLPPMN